MSDRPVVWIRIGMQKTGNSALQSWCTGHMDLMSKHGLAYYRPDKSKHGAGPLVRALTTSAETAAPLISDLCEIIRGNHIAGRQTFLSSENFSTYPPAAFRQLFDALADFDVRIIVVLRRQDIFAEALLKQWIKWNGAAAQNHQAHLRNQILPMLDYHLFLQEWAAACPEATILPMIYAEAEGDAAAPDAVAATFDLMGYPAIHKAETPIYRTNVSPNGALVRHYQTKTDAKRLRQTNRVLMKAHGQDFGGRGDFLSEQDRQELRARFAQSNDRLRKTWFPDKDTLFGEPALQRHGDMAKSVEAFERLYDKG